MFFVDISNYKSSYLNNHRVCVAFITMDDILNIMGVSGIESPAADSLLRPSQLVSGSDSGVT